MECFRKPRPRRIDRNISLKTSDFKLKKRGIHHDKESGENEESWGTPSPKNWLTHSSTKSDENLLNKTEGNYFAVSDATLVDERTDQILSKFNTILVMLYKVRCSYILSDILL